MTEGGATPEERVGYGYRLVLARAPDAQRRQALLRALDGFAAGFRREPEAAREFLKQGESAGAAGARRARNWRRTPAVASLISEPGRDDHQGVSMNSMTRRHFFGVNSTGVGLAALAGLWGRDARAAAHGGLPGLPHFPPKAKRVIYLFQSGGPSQMELFDYKPRLREFQGTDLPESVRSGQRLTGMSASQSSFPVVPSKFAFAQHGQSGAWVSELLPHTAKIADRLTFVKTVNTEEINHDPAVTMVQTGFRLGGRPSMGAWVSYGIGCETEDLPAFCVMISNSGGGQPLYDRLWGSGFLPSQYQGVKFRSVGDPVLYLSNPEGLHRGQPAPVPGCFGRAEPDDGGGVRRPGNQCPRGAVRDGVSHAVFGAGTDGHFRRSRDHTFELYGEDARKPGTFAANCLLARRLAERGVRFIQLYHRDWDHHGELAGRSAEALQGCGPARRRA